MIRSLFKKRFVIDTALFWHPQLRWGVTVNASKPPSQHRAITLMVFGLSFTYFGAPLFLVYVLNFSWARLNNKI